MTVGNCTVLHCKPVVSSNTIKCILFILNQYNESIVISSEFYKLQNDSEITKDLNEYFPVWKNKIYTFQQN